MNCHTGGICKLACEVLPGYCAEPYPSGPPGENRINSRRARARASYYYRRNWSYLKATANDSSCLTGKGIRLHRSRCRIGRLRAC